MGRRGSSSGNWAVTKQWSSPAGGVTSTGAAIAVAQRLQLFLGKFSRALIVLRNAEHEASCLLVVDSVGNPARPFGTLAPVPGTFRKLYHDDAQSFYEQSLASGPLS